MRFLSIILIICLGYGGWVFYQSQVDSKLDYKAMDAKGIPHEWLEYPYQLCMKGHETDERAKKLCICHTNGMLHTLSKDEFITLTKELIKKLPADPAIDGKIKSSAKACHDKYNGS